MLVLGLVVALVRTSRAPALFPLRLLGDGLRRPLPRHPDDPARLPDRLRHPGAAADRACRPTRSCSAGSRSTLSYSAYVAEVYRAGIASVHRGQRDAALAVGLTEAQALRHVILPQAVRRVGAAAAQRLHRPAEGRRPGLDPRPAGGLPASPRSSRRDLQLHAADRRRAALPGVTVPLARVVDRHRRRPEGGGADEPGRRCSRSAA